MICQLLALMLLYGGDIAAAQFSEATDTAELLAFKVGSTDTRTATWTAGTSPCGDGWDDWHAGWQGVTCCASTGSANPSLCDGVSSINSDGDIAPVSANAGRVKYVNLNSFAGVRGDLADLADLTELRQLKLIGTNAHGDIAALLGLPLLDDLYLAGTHVFGDAAAIRATIPGMSGWRVSWTYGYTACSAFATCPADTSPIVGGDDAVGIDACACCDGSLMVREPATGVCVDPDADCAGTWTTCTTTCEDAAARTWTESAPQVGGGAACPVAADCVGGDGACVINDCAGTWSTCSDACEAAAARTWNETSAQAGGGAACPAAVNCVAGDGACSVAAPAPAQAAASAGSMATATATIVIAAAFAIAMAR